MEVTLVVALIAVLAYHLIPLVGTSLRAVRSTILSETTIYSHDASFNWISIWLKDNGYANKAKVTVSSTRNLSKSREEDDWKKDGVKLYSINGRGVHFINHGFPLLLIRSGAGVHDHACREVEMFRLISFRWYSDRIRKLLDEIKEAVFPGHRQSVGMFTFIFDDWTAINHIRKRSLSTIYTAGTIAEDLISDAHRFFDSAENYAIRGIPHRRGYLMYGPPGNGKSSLTLALASELECNIYQLPLDAQINNETLRSAVATIPPRSVLLVEDIDQAFQKRQKQGENLVTFSGVLNCLDGLAAGKSIILIMTTNYIDQLDGALIRPGRIDRKIFMDYPCEKQLRKIFAAFYPDKDATDFISRVPQNTSIAAVQDILLSSGSAEEAADMMSTYIGDPNSNQKLGFAA